MKRGKAKVESHLGPFNSFTEVLLLLVGKGGLDEDLLELLVGVVDDELLEAVLLESLKPVEVQDPKGFVLPMGFYLNWLLISVLTILKVEYCKM